MALRKVVLAGGLGLLAATAIAASQSKPLEAPLPEHGVPAAQHVESVLRATYVLPTGRGESVATFLQENAVAGIDVRFANDQMTVVAPADAQKALGGFIEKCLSKEPRPAQAAPNYYDSNKDFLGTPTPGSPSRVPSRTKSLPSDGFGSQPNTGFALPEAESVPVPNYEDPNDAAFGPATRIQQKAPES